MNKANHSKFVTRKWKIINDNLKKNYNAANETIYNTEGLKSSLCDYKTKSEMTNEFRCFLESNFVGVSRLFVLVYTNEDSNCKRFKVKRYYLPKGVANNYNVIINGKNFYDQPFDLDIKRYEEIRKQTTRQCEDYSTGFLLDYEYSKNCYKLITVDLNRQKELDADSKAIEQIEFGVQLKLDDGNAADGGNDQSRFFQGSVTAL